MFYSVQETVTKIKVLISQMIASCVICLYKLCCLLFYCFKVNWGDNSIEQLIQKFYFQFHLVRKTGTRKLVQVFWYGFSVPVSGACVTGISSVTQCCCPRGPIYKSLSSYHKSLSSSLKSLSLDHKSLSLSLKSLSSNLKSLTTSLNKILCSRLT